MATGARIIITQRDADTSWMAEGNCRKTGLSPSAVATLMHPTDKKDIPRAKSVCRDCPVVERCLEYAQENHFDEGVWGGLDGDERYRLRKNRQRRVSQALRHPIR